MVVGVGAGAGGGMARVVITCVDCGSDTPAPPPSARRTVSAAWVKYCTRRPLVRQLSPIANGIPARSGRFSRSADMNASVFFAFRWLIFASW